MGTKIVPYPPYRPDLAPSDFWLFPKLRGYRYETIEEMKEAVTKVIETLTQEDFHGAFQKFLERYNTCIADGGNYFEDDQSFMCTITKSAHTKKSLETYLMILVFDCVFLIFQSQKINLSFIIVQTLSASLQLPCKFFISRLNYSFSSGVTSDIQDFSEYCNYSPNSFSGLWEQLQRPQIQLTSLSCLLTNSFFVSLKHFFIMWIIVLSLSLNNLLFLCYQVLLFLITRFFQTNFYGWFFTEIQGTASFPYIHDSS